MTTKEQERKALAKIKAIIDELGEDSYIGTAFAGCVQDAENNIDEDAAYSYKDRYEYMANEREAERAKREAAEKALIEANAKLENAQSQIITDSDLRVIIAMVNQKLRSIEDQIDEQNRIIIDYADTPDAKEFRTAVSNRKNQTALYNHYMELFERLPAIR